MKTEPGYHGWLLNADFPLYTKQCLKNEIQKIKAKKAKKAKESNPQGFDAKLNDLKNKFN